MENLQGDGDEAHALPSFPYFAVPSPPLVGPPGSVLSSDDQHGALAAALQQQQQPAAACNDHLPLGEADQLMATAAAPPMVLPAMVDWSSLLQQASLMSPAAAVPGLQEAVQGDQSGENDGGEAGGSSKEKAGKGGGAGRSSSGKKKVSRPRFAFQTRSVNDILDDGYRWRKYGQKAVKNSAHPRAPFSCKRVCNEVAW
ncbi:hypothetical protein EJB05_17090, partial [Eragrostis curvula]